MKIVDLLTKETISLNSTAKNKTDVLKKAVTLMCKSGVINDRVKYEKGVFLREKESTTGVGEGIAIPHCKSKAVDKPHLVAMVIKNGVDYDALDGEKVNLLFLIAAPDTKDNIHLDVLARLSNLLMHEEFKNNLLKAKTKDQFLKVINDAEVKRIKEEKARASKAKVASKKVASKKVASKKGNSKIAVKEKETKTLNILAVTACPTGIAHTFMAEEALYKAAKELGYNIKVETNGQGGVKNKLTEEEINNADAIITACDVKTEMNRFDGKKVLKVSVSEAIKNSNKLLADSLNAPIFKATGGFIKTKEERNSKTGFLHNIYTNLMSGVSHMLPLVVGGGILIAIAFLIDMACGNAGSEDFGSVNEVARLFNQIGGFAFNLMMPILAGFIAHSIAGRPGLIVGLVGGVAANTAKFNLLYWVGNSEVQSTLEKVNAGFIGALIAGFLAGYIIKLLERTTNKMPKSLDGLRSILIYPLFGILIMGLSMFLLNVPFAFVNIGFNKALNWLADNKLLILLCAILATMMATDFGGPINKAAYVFATAAITSTPVQAGAYQVMAAVMIGGMVPPLAVALSMALFPQKYNKEDRENAVTTGLMGLGFITEGVIPYAAKDPLRVIVSCMAGSAVAGALSGVWGAQLRAPHGGVFVFPVVSNVGYYILALVIGTVLSAILLGILKKDDENPELGKWKGINFKKLINFKRK